MNSATKSKIILWAVILFSLQGCLKDNVSPVYNVSIGNADKELWYFENSGDYINSSQMPSVISTDEVFANLNTYLIIDVRQPDEYAAGHISGAVNVGPDSLITFLKNNNGQDYPKVIIISAAGQSSSYYTCLLRLYGYNNIYSLLFGMAEWNNEFSAVWKNNVKDDPEYRSFNNIRYPLNEISDLPSISFGDNSIDIKSKIKDRIANLLKAGFVENINFINYPDLVQNLSNYYVVCYGKDSLYYHDREGTSGSGHFPNAVYYNPTYDIRSSLNLQTFPLNREIVIYSCSGQLSSFLAAYLRVLGYDAKTLLYGASTIFYSYLNALQKTFSPFVFNTSDIKNYPYVTGSSPK